VIFIYYLEEIGGFFGRMVVLNLCFFLINIFIKRIFFVLEMLFVLCSALKLFVQVGALSLPAKSLSLC